VTATTGDEEPDVLLSALIVADLHIVGQDTGAHVRESFIVPHATHGRFRQPDAKLLELIDEKSISADVLICLGDLTSRAGKDGYEYGWKFLEQVADAAHCSSIVFTPGNHDVDSTRRYGGDHRAVLQSASCPDRFRLVPATAHTLEENQFEIYLLNGHIIAINLDTNGDDPQLITGKYGVVDIDTIDQIVQAVRQLGTDLKYGLLICHHHPYRHGDIDLDDYSAIDTAPELINALGRTGVADWTVLHGHKHMPRLAMHDDYVIFAAGSLSASLYGVQACVSANQFYLLEIVSDRRLEPAHSYVGRIQAWDWAVLAWTPAAERGIADHSGFGYVENVTALATKIAQFVDSTDGKICDAETIIEQFPGLPYLMPSHEKQLRQALKAQHAINVLTEKSTAEWRHVGKAPVG
jgi:predicted phosphodiesterase